MSTLGAAWLAMIALHEFGHVLHASISGGQVTEIELPPRGLGHTRVGLNPHPLFVAWGGACWGCSLPLLIWLGVRRWTERYLPLATFFAGMCLIANGAYLAAGGFIGASNDADDAHELLRHGAAHGQLLVLGIPAVLAGLWLWHGLGPVMRAPWCSPTIGTREGILMLAVFLLLLLLGMALGATG
ncbi:MAG TPA: M50 family metallopeptidase [Pirellulales bacterium]|nr:M50 family metallopeptidase [Pirellulales bacterium]